jgi:hypothetical protein
MTRLELAVGIVLLGLCATVFVVMAAQPYWSDYAPGSAFMPFWVAGVGTLLALAHSGIAIRQGAAGEADWPDRSGALRVLLTICALWLFLAAMPWLGVGASAAGFVLLLLLLVQRRRLLPSLATTVVTVGMVELVFIHWLGVRLPRGFLGF